MSDLKCARMLLGAARRDLLTLRGMSVEVPQESFGFHVQQAAEKSLKAWLALLGETYPLTHNLQALLDRLDGRVAGIDEFADLAGYTPYAVEFRYGGVDAHVEGIDRGSAIARIEGLLERVREELRSL